jgi:hypothetical protein
MPPRRALVVPVATGLGGLGGTGGLVLLAVTLGRRGDVAAAVSVVAGAVLLGAITCFLVLRMIRMLYEAERELVKTQADADRELVRTIEGAAARLPAEQGETAVEMLKAMRGDRTDP